VEPLYIRAENGQLPELQRVLASYSDRTVMGTDLESTLAALFGTHENTPPVMTKAGPPIGMGASGVIGAPLIVSAKTGTNSPTNLQTAAEHYDRALTALRQGDWTNFGIEMQKLGEQLGHGGTAPPH
jgi:uncharacterized protein